MLTAGLVLTRVEPRAVGLGSGALLVLLGLAVCGALASDA
jgi:hypothetical protein